MGINHKTSLQLDVLLEQLSDAVLLVDMDGICQRANTSALNLLELPDHVQFIGKPLTAFAPTLDHDWIDTLQPDRLDRRRIDIMQQLVETRTRLLLDDFGQPCGVQIVFQQCSDQARMEKALIESERTLYTLISSLPGVVYRTLNTPAWNALYISEYAHILTGYSPTEFINREINLGDLIHPDDREAVWQTIQTALAQHEIFQITYRLQAKDGMQKWVWEQGMGQYDESGQVISVEGFITDITGHHQAEQALRASEANERALRTLAETLTSTIQLLVESLDTDTVMQRILENVGRVVPLDAANIMLVEDGCAVVKYQYGYPDGVDYINNHTSFSLDVAHFQTMYRSRQPVLYTDTGEDPEWESRNPTLSYIVKSYLGVPIQVHGQVIGFLNLDSERPNFFKEQHVQYLEAFANQAALAIGNAQMYDELRKRAYELSTLHRASSFLFTPLSKSSDLSKMAQQIVNAIVETFGKIDCGIMLLDKDKRELVQLVRAGSYVVRAAHRLPLNGKGLVLEAVRRERVIYAPDVKQHPAYVVGEPRTQSELVIPMMGQQGVIGVLDMQSMELAAFDDMDQTLLNRFAERAATVIENVQLFNELRQSHTDLEERVAERTASLQKANQRIHAILNNNNDGIVLAGADGIIEQANPAFLSMFGISEDTIYGDNLIRYIAPTDRALFAVAIDSLGQNIQSARLDLKGVQQSGDLFDVDVILSNITDPQISGIVCSFRDVTEQKIAEAALRTSLEKERELNELKTRFISMASHDFRTPLTTILSSADLLNLHLDRMFTEGKPPKLEKHFDRIRAAIHHMISLLDDVLIIGRAESNRLKFEPVMLHVYQLCQDTIEDIQILSTTNHVLDLRYHVPIDRHYLLDETLMRQIINNLLSNAIKYSPDGGKVILEVDEVDEQLRLKVTDSGIGIPEEDQKHLFQLFFRATNVSNIQGTGLGLAIIKRAVDVHGGSVEFASNPGEGSTFTVYLPIQHA